MKIPDYHGNSLASFLFLMFNCNKIKGFYKKVYIILINIQNRSN